MTSINFLFQAIASYIAIAAFLVVLNVQKKMLIPGGLLGMLVWLIYSQLKQEQDKSASRKVSQFGNTFLRCFFI